MKILIAHAYAGIGHKKAAEAIAKALAGFKECDVRVVDALDYTNALFKFSYPRVYLFLINRVPLAWGFLYYFFDLKVVDLFFAPLRRFFHGLHARRFARFIVEEKPDVVICTHFLPAEVISGLKRKGDFKGKFITVVTDFLSHSFWLARYSDYFIGAIDRTKKDLISRGIEEERIKVLGIPCDPLFGVSKDRTGLIEKLGLEHGLFNIIIMGGGFGTGPVRKIVTSISNLEKGIRGKLQVAVICGKNKALLDGLNKIKSGMDIKLSAFGFMDNVDEFMEVSDCIITKSGGLTVSESLSKKLPMIIIKPIPGQEMRNCKALTGYGTALRANSVRQVVDYLKDLVSYPEKIIGMKARINLLSYPDAARDIASFARDL